MRLWAIYLCAQFDDRLVDRIESEIDAYNSYNPNDPILRAYVADSAGTYDSYDYGQGSTRRIVRFSILDLYVLFVSERLIIPGIPLQPYLDGDVSWYPPTQYLADFVANFVALPDRRVGALGVGVLDLLVAMPRDQAKALLPMPVAAVQGLWQQVRDHDGDPRADMDVIPQPTTGVRRTYVTSRGVGDAGVHVREGLIGGTRRLNWRAALLWGLTLINTMVGAAVAYRAWLASR